MNSLHSKVVHLQIDASGLGEPATVFIPSGGTTRGISQPSVTRFSGKELYVRIIAIQH
jgi:hypothetical protein